MTHFRGLLCLACTWLTEKGTWDWITWFSVFLLLPPNSFFSVFRVEGLIGRWFIWCPWILRLPPLVPYLYYPVSLVPIHRTSVELLTGFQGLAFESPGSPHTFFTHIHFHFSVLINFTFSSILSCFPCACLSVLKFTQATNSCTTLKDPGLLYLTVFGLLLLSPNHFHHCCCLLHECMSLYLSSYFSHIFPKRSWKICPPIFV